ncbi:Hypp447 [Branchiostoma lanceolatum]|uniref:Hypp447 protein n=1 Tax=Branchiostoma lanceolatum TaxID=7740 RepID=A0A8J9YJD8_BRALA|nr:Hypp447 [Branchiostoma lanceolatum]
MMTKPRREKFSLWSSDDPVVKVRRSRKVDHWAKLRAKVPEEFLSLPIAVELESLSSSCISDLSLLDDEKRRRKGRKSRQRQADFYSDSGSSRSDDSRGRKAKHKERSSDSASRRRRDTICASSVARETYSFDMDTFSLLDRPATALASKQNKIVAMSSLSSTEEDILLFLLIQFGVLPSSATHKDLRKLIRKALHGKINISLHSNGNYVHTNGVYINVKGNYINTKGLYINTDGNFIGTSGTYVNIVKKDGKMEVSKVPPVTRVPKPLAIDCKSPELEFEMPI